MDIQTDARRERYIESAFGVPESKRKRRRRQEEKNERGEWREPETLVPPESIFLRKFCAKSFAIPS